MDLQELSKRTGIPVRRLRYCVDHDLIPGLKINTPTGEVGRRRKFGKDAGFGIACAAVLIGRGFDRNTVRKFLKGLVSLNLHSKSGESAPALEGILNWGFSAQAELGDGVNVRLVCPEIPYNSGWICPGNPASLDKSYRPTTYIGLDLGQIRDKVYGSV